MEQAVRLVGTWLNPAHGLPRYWACGPSRSMHTSNTGQASHPCNSARKSNACITLPCTCAMLCHAVVAGPSTHTLPEEAHSAGRGVQLGTRARLVQPSREGARRRAEAAVQVPVGGQVHVQQLVRVRHRHVGATGQQLVCGCAAQTPPPPPQRTGPGPPRRPSYLAPACIRSHSGLEVFVGLGKKNTETRPMPERLRLHLKRQAQVLRGALVPGASVADFYCRAV